MKNLNEMIAAVKEAEAKAVSAKIEENRLFAKVEKLQENGESFLVEGLLFTAARKEAKKAKRAADIAHKKLIEFIVNAAIQKSLLEGGGNLSHEVITKTIEDMQAQAKSALSA